MTSNWQQYAMTVKNLKDALSQFPDDTPVIMAKDAEGNGYSPCGGIWPAHYEADSTYSGEVLDSEDDWQAGAHEFSERSYQEYLGDAVPVVLLGPVN